MDPANSDIIYAGTVAGGVWVSEDAGVTWTPLTDQLPSLAIDAITVAPRDNAGALVTLATPRSHLVVYAGTGQNSSSGVGGLSIGLLRSDDGGSTWTVLAPVTFQGVLINSVVVLTDKTILTPTNPAAQVVVVSAAKYTAVGSPPGGIFVSTDSGATFTRKINGSGTDLVADPGQPGRAYAAVSLDGVYRTDNYGVDWGTSLTAGFDLTADGFDNDANGIADDGTENASGAARIILAIQQDPASATNAVYAALLSRTILMGVFTSAPEAGAGHPQGVWSLLGDAPAHPFTASPPVHATLVVDGTTGLQFGSTAAHAAAPLTISRQAGDWGDEGFAPGQTITVTGAGVNNGQFVVATFLSDPTRR